MGITVRVRISGARETLAAFRDLPKDASDELREANKQISDELADKIRSAAGGSDEQSALMVRSIRATRDRVPSVTAGGNRRVGKQSRKSSGQDYTRASDILFGANFGASTLRQFRPHTGAGEDDYWFFRTVEANEERIAGEWGDAADRVLTKWGGA